MNRSELRAKVLSGRGIGKQLTSWDEVEITQDEVDWRKSEWNEEEMGIFDEDEVWGEVYQDYTFWEMEWEFVTDHLGEILEGKNEDGDPWYVEVRGFGWRGLDGYKLVRTNEGAEFIGEILPDTPCTWIVYEWKDGIAVQNYHHDSPTGNEWYYAEPLRGVMCPRCGREYEGLEEYKERKIILEWDRCPDCLAERFQWDLHQEGGVYTRYLYEMGKVLDEYNLDEGNRGYYGERWLDHYLEGGAERFAPEVCPWAEEESW